MNFPSIRILGNILTFDILEKIAIGDAPQQTPREYGFNSKDAMRLDIQDAWAMIRSQYQVFQHRMEKLGEDKMGAPDTQTYFLIPLFQRLNFELENVRRKAQIIEGSEKSYNISHLDENLEGFPIHIVGASQSLDKKRVNARMSPHAMVQEYLNHHENLYSIVSNGKTLRLLRDSSLLTRLSFIEFDMVKMMEEELFADFAVLYRLLHVTRMPRKPEEGDSSIIESYHQEGLKSGSRIREKLSEAVEKGIKHLATGLLKEPENQDLRDWVIKTQEAPKQYYDHLLKLIYRLLFLMVIEERDLIYPSLEKEIPSGKKSKLLRLKKIYYDHYSLGRLRKLSLLFQTANPRQYDLWENLLNTFQLFEPGSRGQKLGIAPLAGDLFTSKAIGILYECKLNNRILMECLRGLSQFENDHGVRIAVNYASLDVEEFGSVYEGLLDYDPAINTNNWIFDFIKGDDRGSSGAHYTPDELVQPLIKHSLEHLIQDRTVALDSPEPKKQQAIQSILSLTVCDVACGSGHILLAAARRIGLVVARLRSGEEQPNPKAIRLGVRDAIRHCIYGVDKNPLAVELCKVALWLEAHIPGEPLNFLDHKIKNGDAIVGLTHIEELQNGIATEAFKVFEDNEKKLCALLRKTNKAERKSREAGQLVTSSMIESIGSKLETYRQRFQEFRKMPESTVSHIKAKQTAYKKLNSGSNWWFVNNLANLQVAQFFVSKTQVENVVTDSEYFDIMAGRKTQTKAEALALIEAQKQKIFHWFLEFPEVFAEGGFDCVLGNPPYLGGMKLSGFFGDHYLAFLQHNFSPAQGRCDLIAYFFRKSFGLLNSCGILNFLTTNSISEGETREGGLKEILNNHGFIHYANKSVKWPGQANVFISIVGLQKKRSSLLPILNRKQVEFINSYLYDSPELEPYSLLSNKDLCIEGSKPNGKGFVISADLAKRLIEEDENNKRVIHKYLGNQGMSNSPYVDTDRYVIFFYDWDYKKSSNYLKCIDILKETVFPERKKKSKKLRENWWLFEHPSLRIYDFFEEENEFAIVVGNTGKYLPFESIKSGFVIANTCNIILSDKFKDFAILSSSFHTDWIGMYGPKLKTDLRYVPSSCFETFAFSINTSLDIQQGLELIGKTYFTYRRQLLIDIKLGLTKTYNQFHNASLEQDHSKIIQNIDQYKPAELKKKLHKETLNLYKHLEKTEATISILEAVTGITKLQNLHKEMDEAVLEAYGWHIGTRRWGLAIDLRHDFYEVDYLPENDRVRYTIHPDARKEVLKRLLLLNHEIHEAEEREITYEELEREKVIELLREQVESWLPQTDTLEVNSLKFLCSGEDLIPNIDKSLVKSYKPFVTQYSSAVENELQHKLFIAFNDHFQSQYEDDDESQKKKIDFLKTQMAIDTKMNLFCKNLIKNDVKYTLGNMHFILNLVYKPNGNTIKQSQLLQDFRAFVLAVYNDQIINKTFMQELNAFIQAYRNEAAHTGDIDKAGAEACRDEVRRLMGLLVGNEVN